MPPGPAHGVEQCLGEDGTFRDVISCPAPLSVKAHERPGVISDAESLNICVLFDTVDGAAGGGNQFLKALIAELGRLGHEVTTRPTRVTEVVLVNGFNYGPGRHLNVQEMARLRQTGRMGLSGRFAQLRDYRTKRRRGPVLVHRVDGVPRLTRGVVTRADHVQPAVNSLADHTVFQTDFCRTSFTRHGGRQPARWCVINNAVDPRIFFPGHVARVRSDKVLRLVATSWSTSPSKGFAALASISRLPGVELAFAGNWCPDVDPADTTLVGVLRSEKLADLLRASDAMVHAAVNEPCSNSIVEALACGLPVLYQDSGGNRELAGDYGVPLTPDYSGAVSALAKQWTAIREKVLDDRGRFLIDRAAAEYVAAFRGLIRGEDS